MDYFLQIVVQNSLSVITTMLTTAIAALVTSILRKYKAMEKSLLAVNHDRLYQACNFYILTNQITTEELKNLEYLYEGYASLGGNGTGKLLYEKCKELPFVDIRTTHTTYHV